MDDKPEVFLNIKYDALYSNETDIQGVEYLTAFRAQLDSTYRNTFHIRQAERGGYGFEIQVLVDIGLEPFLSAIASGVMWDMVKHGGRSFVLRPFFEAYRNFVPKPCARRIRDIHFKFKDTTVIVYGIVHQDPADEFQHLGGIYKAMSLHFERLINRSGVYPFLIVTPLFADRDVKKGEIVYRAKQHVDETLSASVINLDSYLKLWGVEYADYSKVIFSVPDQKIVNVRWYDEDQFFFTFLRDDLI